MTDPTGTGFHGLYSSSATHRLREREPDRCSDCRPRPGSPAYAATQALASKIGDWRSPGFHSQPLGAVGRERATAPAAHCASPQHQSTSTPPRRARVAPRVSAAESPLARRLAPGPRRDFPRWHRELFEIVWSRKFRPIAQPKRLAPGVVALIQATAKADMLWGAERIRGELLKLGIRASKRTVQKYMRGVRGPGRGGQTWPTFIENQREGIWAGDFLQLDDVFSCPILTPFFLKHATQALVRFNLESAVERGAGWVMLGAWQGATTSERAIARSCNTATRRAARALRPVAPSPCG